LPTFRTPRDNLEITGVLGFILGEIEDLRLKVNPDEVSFVFTRTIDELCSKENTGDTTFRGSKSLYTTPTFLAGNFKIWGITAMLLQIVLARLVPHMYKKTPRPVTFRRGYTPVEKTR